MFKGLLAICNLPDSPIGKVPSRSAFGYPEAEDTSGRRVVGPTDKKFFCFGYGYLLLSLRFLLANWGGGELPDGFGALS